MPENPCHRAPAQSRPSDRAPWRNETSTLASRRHSAEHRLWPGMPSCRPASTAPSPAFEVARAGLGQDAQAPRDLGAAFWTPPRSRRSGPCRASRWSGIPQAAIVRADLVSEDDAHVLLLPQPPNSILKSISLSPMPMKMPVRKSLIRRQIQDLVELLVRCWPKAVTCSSVTMGSPSSSDL
jgi:hypothetical protein